MSGTTNIGGKGPPGDISFNYIPLIDVTFNLIIFFVLTSEIATAQKAQVLVPNPHVPQAVPRDAMSNNSVIVAVLSQAAYRKDATDATAAEAFRYEVDGQVVADDSTIDELVARIKKKRVDHEEFLATSGQKGEFFVEIRADKRLAFGKVQKVIEAIAGAGIPKMAISTKRAG